jgi:hypothetical protein
MFKININKLETFYLKIRWWKKAADGMISNTVYHHQYPVEMLARSNVFFHRFTRIRTWKTLMAFQFFMHVHKIAKSIYYFRHVCLSVRRIEQLGPHCTDFNKNWYWSILRKSVDKVRVLLKSDENNGYIT